MTTSRPPVSAPVVVCIYKVTVEGRKFASKKCLWLSYLVIVTWEISPHNRTDKANDVWRTVVQDSAYLYQIQIQHDRLT